MSVTIMKLNTLSSITLSTLCVAACASSPAPAPTAGDAPDAGAQTTPDTQIPVQPRLRVSAGQLLGPDGNPILLRGYNWGEWGTMQPQDGSDNLKQGANSVRVPLRWWGDWKPGVDSYVPDDNVPGHIDPAHLAYLDTVMQEAAQNHLWVTLFIDSNNGQGAEDDTNGDDNFWTDPTMKAQFITAWQTVVKRYRDMPYLAAYEILPEPRPTNVSDQAVHDFYDSIIPSIRALDPRTPIVVGPNHAYDFHHIDAAYTTIDPNIIYTGDYFIFPDADPLDRIPAIQEFQSTYTAPVWVNQVGIETGDANASSLASQVLTAFAPINVGWAWWTYRDTTTLSTQHGIFYSDGNNGWLEKTCWFNLVGGFLAGAPDTANCD